MTPVPVLLEQTLPVSEITGSTVIHELDVIRLRTRKGILVSILLHLTLLLALGLAHKFAPDPVVVTEITWLEPEPTQPAAVPTAPRVPDNPPVEQMQFQPPTTRETAHFQREAREARVEPRPQESKVARDRLTDRLTSLQQKAARQAQRPALLAAPQLTPASPGLARVDDRAQGAAPAKLTRGETRTAAPLELRREPTKTTTAVATVTPPPETAKPHTAEKADGAVAQRTLAGARLIGPVADRRVLSYRRPLYPEWAKQDAVQGSVRLYFVVLPGGHVKENILVQKTSGYEDFDRNAMVALRDWRFEPLTSANPGEQWGEITFHFRLSDTQGE